MKVVTKILFAAVVLTTAGSTVSGLAKDETPARFVFTYEIPGGGFFDDLPHVKSIDEAIDFVADSLNATWTKIKNFEIPGFKIQVNEMTPVLAQAVSQLPFVKTMERDVQIQANQPINSKIVPLSVEETPYGINLVGALQVPDDPVGNRVVCIIDSGYDINHPDLSDTAVGIDTPAGPWFQDGIQHGTHVSGTISALGGNGQGVVGVNRNGQIGIIIVRLFDDSGSAWTTDLIQLVTACVENGANIVSMSLGRTEGGPLEIERAAFQQYYDDGVLFVAAAGNHGSSQDGWPASYESVISVAAIDENKKVASFSAFNDQVELSGPGVGVLSTIPGGQYAYFDGTSMACPHVSGVAALVWSHFPDKSNAEIRYALQQSAEDLGSIPGRDADFGFGLVRADLAYNFLASGNTGTPGTTPTPSPINDGDDEGGCMDYPADWTDSDGDGCAFYDSEFQCMAFGSSYRDAVYNLVANDVCCTCGGGASSNCVDEAGWTDSDGDGCAWYAEDPLTRCSVFGSCCENNGFTASEACCVCDGILATTIQALSKDSPRGKQTEKTIAIESSGAIPSFTMSFMMSLVMGILWYAF